ncbi:MAG: hypothetical protein WD578_00370 [Bacteroidales bacterium]
MKMKHYIRQFMEDMEVLMRQPPPSSTFGASEDYMVYMNDVREQLLGDKGILIQNLSGISREQLPSIELLSDDEVSLLASGLVKLLYHFNCYPDIPHEAPDSMAYNALRNHWEHLKAPLMDFELHYEFCDGLTEQCPFPGYCSWCGESDNESAMSAESSEEEGTSSEQGNEIEIEISLGEHLVRIRTIPGGTFISGIHNYCDRWCEFCALANRCTVNAAGDKVEPDKEKLEIRQEGMKELEQQFRGVERKIKKEMQRLNVDVFELSKNEGFSILDKEDIVFNPDARDVMTIAEHYTKSIHEWVKREGVESLNEEINNSLVFSNIMWYSTIIATKMYRSLMREFEDEDSVQNDLNGSAKVALHGIRQSLYGWGWIIERCPGQKDTAMFHAMLLTGMRSAMEERFPRAEEFIRPGFDEE